MVFEKGLIYFLWYIYFIVCTLLHVLEWNSNENKNEGINLGKLWYYLYIFYDSRSTIG